MKKNKICIIGLGYVGLPLAHAFSEKYQVVGFDINKARIDELNNGFDRTLELTDAQVKESLINGMKFTLNVEDIKDSNIYIITVFYHYFVIDFLSLLCLIIGTPSPHLC